MASSLRHSAGIRGVAAFTRVAPLVLLPPSCSILLPNSNSFLTRNALRVVLARSSALVAAFRLADSSCYSALSGGVAAFPKCVASSVYCVVKTSESCSYSFNTYLKYYVSALDSELPPSVWHLRMSSSSVSSKDENLMPRSSHFPHFGNSKAHSFLHQKAWLIHHKSYKFTHYVLISKWVIM